MDYMTDIRDRALAAAIEVWAADCGARDGWGGPVQPSHILHLADAFAAWLSRPNPAAHLTLTVSDMRPIDPERQTHG